MNLLVATNLPQTTEAGLTVWGMILKGGWLMVPIFMLSVIAVYIFFERYLLLRKYARDNSRFMDNIRSCLLHGKDGEATGSCREEDTPMSRILIKGIRYRELPAAELRPLLESSANTEVSAMEKGLSVLATCAGMAPMIGFLGTVVGMVQAFYDMSVAGNNVNITLLSRGIYTAMITTVAGLITGIVAHFAYNALTSLIDKVVNNMENTIAGYLEILYEIKTETERKLNKR